MLNHLWLCSRDEIIFKLVDWEYFSILDVVFIVPFCVRAFFFIFWKPLKEVSEVSQEPQVECAKTTDCLTWTQRVPWSKEIETKLQDLCAAATIKAIREIINNSLNQFMDTNKAVKNRKETRRLRREKVCWKSHRLQCFMTFLNFSPSCH